MELLEGLLLVLTFILLLGIGVPVAWTLGIVSLLTLSLSLDPLTAMRTLGQRFMVSLDSFPLLAIPFFILAGQLMNQGGIARRLIDFAKSMVGALPGGLAHITVVGAMLFGAISGSSVAAASAIGSIIGPRMEEEGYSREFGAAINVTSSSMGLVIPPSNVMIIYSLASGGTSIAALFVAGYIPGILTGLFLMAIAGIIAIRKRFPVGDPVRGSVVVRAFFRAVPSLFLLVVVIGGIVAGIFTATEAAAIAVLYCLALGFYYRELAFRQLPDLLLAAAATTAIVMLLVATSISMSWVLSFENIPQSISGALLSLSDNKIVILLLINLILLTVGMFMDITPAVLIFTPIFLPVVTALGVHPVHFGIIMILNLCIGICTPPVGTLLFVGVSIANTTIARVVRPLLPLFGGMILALLLVTFWPTLSTWLPRAFGLM
jgi:tripartite ATP-independent transporter DctM subunit